MLILNFVMIFFLFAEEFIFSSYGLLNMIETSFLLSILLILN